VPPQLPRPSDETGDLLDDRKVVGYLRQRGLIGTNEAKVEPLHGGVSNIVLGVSGPSCDLVLKQSLPRLRVADDWPALRSRALIEADALSLLGRITPGAVPRVLDRDPERFAIVVERAPRDWANWKTLLLHEIVDQEVAGRLGCLLARWHNATLGEAGVPPQFLPTTGFEQLRVDPYYRTVARRHPSLAPALGRMADQLLSHRQCLVHGDFSPKNVLVGRGPQMWVIDFEVAHFGDPAFDIAFLVSHLFIKSVHLPRSAAGLDACITSFTTSYEATTCSELAPSWAYVLAHVGCLLLARVDGKSPVEYLSPQGRDRVRELGRLLLHEPPESPSGLAGLREERAASRQRAPRG
jgi:tRNA A-37 threonylcarbamoyl transferase component Bud32